MSRHWGNNNNNATIQTIININYHLFIYPKNNNNHQEYTL